MTWFVTPAMLDNFSSLVELSFEDNLTLFSFLPKVSNGQGGFTKGFATPISVKCKVDDDINTTTPDTEEDNIVDRKVLRTIYVPRTTIVKIGDEVETSGGNPSGVVIRYKVIDITRESGQTDIALLAEEK